MIIHFGRSILKYSTGMNKMIDTGMIDPLIDYVTSVTPATMRIEFTFPVKFDIDFFQTARIIDNLEIKYNSFNTVLTGNFRDRVMYEALCDRIIKLKIKKG